MNTFYINNKNYSQYVKALRTDYEYILSGASGINAKGQSVVDKIGTKRIVTVGFIPMTKENVSDILSSIDTYSVCITYRDAKQNKDVTINAHTSNPSVGYLMLRADNVLVDGFELVFTEI